MRRVLATSVLLLLIGAILAWSAPTVRAQAAEPAHGKAAADEHAAGAHAGGDHTGPPLSFKADLALWSAVTFLLFIFVLGRFAWRPLISGLNQRESKIREDIFQAEENRLKAEEMLAEHGRKMAKVHEEIRDIIAEARRDAEHVKQEILMEAQKEANASKERAIHEIGRARDGALKDLFDVMATEVARATEHVLGRSLNEADQDRLIDEALADFPRS
jgi:F-type H+-transporting ATPase subunit b